MHSTVKMPRVCRVILMFVGFGCFGSEQTEVEWTADAAAARDAIAAALIRASKVIKPGWNGRYQNITTAHGATPRTIVWATDRPADWLVGQAEGINAYNLENATITSITSGVVVTSGVAGAISRSEFRVQYSVRSAMYSIARQELILGEWQDDPLDAMTFLASASSALY